MFHVKLFELEIKGVRNLSHVQLKDLANTNIFYGDNGAGKSSVLEAIHMLGLGRSFRSIQLKPVISYGKDLCMVFGRLERKDGAPLAVGIERPLSGGFGIRIGGEQKKSVVSLAEALPIQLINATSYLLLEGGPKKRRQFLDWGVFHVEHSFYDLWRRAQRCLKQRNQILRSKKEQSALEPWNIELSHLAAAIDLARKRYIEAFVPEFLSILSELTKIEGVVARHFSGWKQDKPYIEQLRNDFTRDVARGFTHQGPHRADLKVTVNGINAYEVLSRGQQKLVVSAMRLAQINLLHSGGGKRCVLLVDDLPAEIDSEHQERFCQLIDRMGVQTFITCISCEEVASLPWHNSGPPLLFHVEQGQIQAPSVANAVLPV